MNVNAHRARVLLSVVIHWKWPSPWAARPGCISCWCSRWYQRHSPKSSNMWKEGANWPSGTQRDILINSAVNKLRWPVCYYRCCFLIKMTSTTFRLKLHSLIGHEKFGCIFFYWTSNWRLNPLSFLWHAAPSGETVPSRVSGSPHSGFRVDYTPQEVGMSYMHRAHKTVLGLCSLTCYLPVWL